MKTEKENAATAMTDILPIENQSYLRTDGKRKIDLPRHGQNCP